EVIIASTMIFSADSSCRVSIRCCVSALRSGSGDDCAPAPEIDPSAIEMSRSELRRRNIEGPDLHSEAMLLAIFFLRGGRFKGSIRRHSRGSGPGSPGAGFVRLRRFIIFTE